MSRDLGCRPHQPRVSTFPAERAAWPIRREGGATVVPVIIDTDFGTDLDDHWALMAALAAPELDIRLITLCSGDTDYRAKLISELLATAGRTDIPIALGKDTVLRSDTPLHTLPERAEQISLAEYSGTILDDAAGALVDTICSSDERVTVLAIGPATNLAAALERDPSITESSRLVAMAGWIRGGVIIPGVYSAPDEAQLEYNVESDIDGFRKVVDSDWEITLSPIDACGKIFVREDRYQQLQQADTPVLRLLFDTYSEWLTNPETYIEDQTLIDRSSTPLCDTLPIVHSYRDDFSEFEDLKLSLADDGVLAESPQGRPVRVAMGWKDLDGFLDHLTERLLTTGAH